MGKKKSDAAKAVEKSLHFGINSKRRCRDVPCLLLFIIFWFGMALVSQAGIENGDLRQLTVPRDHLQNFCGLENESNDNAFKNQTGNPVLYFLDPFGALNPNSTSICLSDCPNATVWATPENAICDYGVEVENMIELSNTIADGTCSPYSYSSLPLFGRCIPIQPIPENFLNETISVGNTTISLNSILTAGQAETAQAISEVGTTWPILAAGAGTAIILSFIWLYLAQFVVGAFVWLCITLVNLVLIGAAIGSYLYWNSRKVAYESGTLPSGLMSIITPLGNFTPELPFLSSRSPATSQDVEKAMIIFIVLVTLAAIILLITIAMIKRIRLAIRIINEASEAFRKMPGITVLPLGFAIVMIGLFAQFLFVLLNLLTPKGPSTLTIVGYFGDIFSQNPNTTTYMLYYHIFGFIWTYYTIVGILHCTVAGAVAMWYWNPRKSESLGSPVLSSLARVLKFHLGSIMLGSLLIAIVEFIRIFLYTLQKKVAKSEVRALKYIVAVAQCCMKFVQMLMKFINRNAYVYMAITGKSFFKSASAATALLLRNAAKTVAVTFIGDIALFFAKIVVVGANCFIAFFVLTYTSIEFIPYVDDPTVTIILIGVETFIIVSVFFSNYQLAIDTIFLSVLEDLDKNDGSPERPYMMSDAMKKIMSKKNKKEKKKEKEKEEV